MSNLFVVVLRFSVALASGIIVLLDGYWLLSLARLRPSRATSVVLAEANYCGVDLSMGPPGTIMRGDAPPRGLRPVLPPQMPIARYPAWARCPRRAAAYQHRQVDTSLYALPGTGVYLFMPFSLNWRVIQNGQREWPVLHTSREFSLRHSVSRECFCLASSRFTRAVSSTCGEVRQCKTLAQSARVRRLFGTTVLTASGCPSGNC
jgi:hypothetical protein